jgi:hypothetical protein
MARKKYEKHRAYYEMRDELRKAKRCAFCSLESKAMHQFFDGLLYEKVTDPGIRSSLAKSAGFCPRHAYMIVGYGDALGTAILYEDQLKLRMEALEGMKHPSGRQRGLQSFNKRDQETCLACRKESQMRMGHVYTLLQSLTDPEMTEALVSSAGLCFPHFTLAVNGAKVQEVRDVLIRVQQEKLQDLLSHLKEFVDKHDHRRSLDSFAEEKDSWMRAVEVVCGSKGVF